MERAPASANEYGAKAGTIASHRFLGGHTWMASMRGDEEHLRRTREKLVGAAPVDVSGGGIERLPRRAVRGRAGGGRGVALAPPGRRGSDRAGRADRVRCRDPQPARR